MKSKKFAKAISLTLIVVLLVLAIPILSVSAADPPKSATLIIEAPNSVENGKAVRVHINVEDNGFGFDSIQFELNYPSSKLTYVSCTARALTAVEAKVKSTGTTVKVAGSYAVNNPHGGVIKNDARLLTLTFTANQTISLSASDFSLDKLDNKNILVNVAAKGSDNKPVIVTPNPVTVRLTEPTDDPVEIIEVIIGGIFGANFNIDDDGLLTGFTPNTPANDVNDFIDALDDAGFELCDNTDTPFTKGGTKKVGTGSYVKQKGGSKVVIIIVYGDVTGSGDITSTDVSMVYRHLRKQYMLVNEYFIAAKVTGGGGDITSTDVSMIYRYLRKQITSFPIQD